MDAHSDSPRPSAAGAPPPGEDPSRDKITANGDAGPLVDPAAAPRNLALTGDHLTDVLLAADRAAEEILDAARSEAEEYASEARQSTVARAESLRQETDNLMARASELTRQVIELTRATEEVMASSRAELSLDAPGVVEESFGALPEAELEAEAVDGEAEVIAEVDLPADETLGSEAELGIASAAEVVEAEPAADPEASKRRGLFRRRRPRKQAAPDVSASPPDPTLGEPRESGGPQPTVPVTEGARSIARQMLAAGLSEEEVTRQLRDQFRLANPEAVLDSVGGRARSHETSTDGEDR